MQIAEKIPVFSSLAKYRVSVIPSKPITHIYTLAPLSEILLSLFVAPVVVTTQVKSSIVSLEEVINVESE